jgi:small multidrug resistance family-3 protein
MPAMTTSLLKTLGLFAVTAAAEIFGCYAVYLWLKLGRSAWWLCPAALSLAAFAWLLTLHPMATGRTYAAYGGVYITAALLWLWRVDKQIPDAWDFIGVSLCLAGCVVSVIAPR